MSLQRLNVVIAMRKTVFQVMNFNCALFIFSNGHFFRAPKQLANPRAFLDLDGIFSSETIDPPGHEVLLVCLLEVVVPEETSVSVASVVQ